MNLYESFAQATQLGDLHTCLMMDMKACQEDDVRLLCYLTPSIYTEVGRAPVCRGWISWVHSLERLEVTATSMSPSTSSASGRKWKPSAPSQPGQQSSSSRAL